MQFAFCVFKYFRHGGIPRDLTKVLREALVRGHSVRLYTLRAEAPVPPGAELIEIGIRAISNHVAYAKFAAKVADHLAEFPVDLVVGFNKMPGLDVYYAGDSCFEEKARLQRGWYYRLTPRYRHFAKSERAVFGADQSTKILTLVAPQIEVFKRYYATPDHRFFLVPPGLDPALRADAPRDTHLSPEPALREEMGLPAEQKLLLFIGSGFIKKGLDRVLTGLAALPAALRDTTTLLVAGQDREKNFRRMAERLGVASAIRFLGGRDDVPRLLAAADALVLPAYDEAGGIVIIEAIVAGLPVLATANCGYASHVEDADAGIVLRLPFDPTEFASGLKAVLTSERRPDWIENGRRYGLSADLFALPQRTVDLLERFTKGEVRPVIAMCTFRYRQFGGRDTIFLRIALACSKRGFHVRIFTGSWDGARPADIEIKQLPAASTTSYKRFQRYARWVRRTLQTSPVHCVIGFDKIPGLDIYFANEVPLQVAAERRLRRYRRSPNFNVAKDVERNLLNSDVEVVYASEADGARFGLADGRQGDVLPATAGLVGPDTLVERCARREFVLLFISSDFVRDGLDRVLFMLSKLVKLSRFAAEGSASVVLVVASPSLAGGGFPRMADGLGVGEFIRFEAPHDLTECFGRADLLLHVPYFPDPNPNVLDAMMCGVPVVTVADSGYAESVRIAGAGTVLDEPFDQEQLLHTVAAAFEADSLKVWRSNTERFRASATGQTMTDRMIEIIERRIERRGQALSA